MSEIYKGMLPNEGCITPFVPQVEEGNETYREPEAKLEDVVVTDMSAATYSFKRPVRVGAREPRCLRPILMCTNLIDQSLE